VITPKGYRRISVNGRLWLEHVLVWERTHGRSVPAGHDVHHVDGDKLNNDPSNLLLLTKLEHKRIHSGCVLVDGVWWKPCKYCGRTLPVTEEHWYFHPDGYPHYGRCRPCQIRRAVEGKRARRARALAAAGEAP
jgi:HNH endonuclease